MNYEYLSYYNVNLSMDLPHKNYCYLAVISHAAADWQDIVLTSFLIGLYLGRYRADQAEHETIVNCLHINTSNENDNYNFIKKLVENI